MADKGMGRGLAAILPASGIGEPAYREIPVGMIQPNPDQPRKHFDQESIEALGRSLTEAGIVQPLIVRPLDDGRYELIAGERRWRAATHAGIEAVPALVRSDDEMQRLQTALIENVARENLNPVEEGRACAALVDELGVSKEELGRRLGRSRVAISNVIRLLDLPDEALLLLETGDLTEGHGRAILQVRDEGVRLRLAKAAVDGGWSVRETERRAKEGSSANGRPKAELHPDLEEALARAEDELESALGTGVKVRANGKGIRAELRFEDLDDLLDFARRTGSPPS